MYQDGDFARWRRHPWHGLEAVPEGADEGIVQAYIEMLPSDTVKYELDKNSGFLMVDRPQRTSATRAHQRTRRHTHAWTCGHTDIRTHGDMDMETRSQGASSKTSKAPWKN